MTTNGTAVMIVIGEDIISRVVMAGYPGMPHVKPWPLFPLVPVLPGRHGRQWHCPIRASIGVAHPYLQDQQ